MNPKFIKAFKEIIREELLKKNTIELEDFGRFELVHKKQHQKTFENGQVLMMPPKDVVVFTPEMKGDS